MNQVNQTNLNPDMPRKTLLLLGYKDFEHDSQYKGTKQTWHAELYGRPSGVDRLHCMSLHI
jgi:hypothetical protein